MLHPTTVRVDDPQEVEMVLRRVNELVGRNASDKRFPAAFPVSVTPKNVTAARLVPHVVFPKHDGYHHIFFATHIRVPSTGSHRQGAAPLPGIHVHAPNDMHTAPGTPPSMRKANVAYMIARNKSVYRVRVTGPPELFANTLVEGELMRMSKHTNAFMMFRALYIYGVDVRSDSFVHRQNTLAACLNSNARSPEDARKAYSNNQFCCLEQDLVFKVKRPFPLSQMKHVFERFAGPSCDGVVLVPDVSHHDMLTVFPELKVKQEHTVDFLFAASVASAQETHVMRDAQKKKDVDKRVFVDVMYSSGNVLKNAFLHLLMDGHIAFDLKRTGKEGRVLRRWIRKVRAAGVKEARMVMECRVELERLTPATAGPWNKAEKEFVKQRRAAHRLLEHQRKHGMTDAYLVQHASWKDLYTGVAAPRSFAYVLHCTPIRLREDKTFPNTLITLTSTLLQSAMLPLDKVFDMLVPTQHEHEHEQDASSVGKGKQPPCAMAEELDTEQPAKTRKRKRNDTTEEDEEEEEEAQHARRLPAPTQHNGKSKGKSKSKGNGKSNNPVLHQKGKPTTASPATMSFGRFDRSVNTSLEKHVQKTRTWTTDMVISSEIAKFSHNLDHVRKTLAKYRPCVSYWNMCADKALEDAQTLTESWQASYKTETLARAEWYRSQASVYARITDPVSVDTRIATLIVDAAGVQEQIHAFAARCFQNENKRQVSEDNRTTTTTTTTTATTKTFPTQPTHETQEGKESPVFRLHVPSHLSNWNYVMHAPERHGVHSPKTDNVSPSFVGKGGGGGGQGVGKRMGVVEGEGGEAAAGTTAWYLSTPERTMMLRNPGERITTWRARVEALRERQNAMETLHARLVRREKEKQSLMDYWNLLVYYTQRGAVPIDLERSAGNLEQRMRAESLKAPDSALAKAYHDGMRIIHAMDAPAGMHHNNNNHHKGHNRGVYDPVAEEEDTRVRAALPEEAIHAFIRQKMKHLAKRVFEEFALAPTSLWEESEMVCTKCGQNYEVLNDESALVCPQCGITVSYANTNRTGEGKRSLKRQNLKKPRHSHHGEYANALRRAQVLEKRDVPEKVQRSVAKYLLDQGKHPDQVTVKCVNQALHALRLNDWYKHMASVYAVLTGRYPTLLTSLQKRRVMMVFELNDAFYRLCVAKRRNFVKYSWFARQNFLRFSCTPSISTHDRRVYGDLVEFLLNIDGQTILEKHFAVQLQMEHHAGLNIHVPGLELRDATKVFEDRMTAADLTHTPMYTLTSPFVPPQGFQVSQEYERMSHNERVVRAALPWCGKGDRAGAGSAGAKKSIQ